MTVEIMQVKCPNCGTIKTINGTEERVRCANKESCGMRYYVKKNIVPKTGTVNKPYKSRWDPSNLSILRTFYYFLTGDNDRGNKEDLIVRLIVELGKL